MVAERASNGSMAVTDQPFWRRPADIATIAVIATILMVVAIVTVVRSHKTPQTHGTYDIPVLSEDDVSGHMQSPPLKREEPGPWQRRDWPATDPATTKELRSWYETYRRDRSREALAAMIINICYIVGAWLVVMVFTAIAWSRSRRAARPEPETPG